jgi:RNA polymerase sigma-70 factor (ECF subfamily)
VSTDLDRYQAAIVAGDPDAFGRWVAGAERPLRRSLRALAASVDVEAVLQEALLRTWQVAPRFVADGAPNGLLRLCHRIARNLALDELRRARVLPTDSAALERAFAEVSTPLSDGPDPLLRRSISECRERLPRQPAVALAARLSSAGADPDEVLAERSGMRLNTFLQNFTRARKLLADCLRRRGVDLGGLL